MTNTANYIIIYDILCLQSTVEIKQTGEFVKKMKKLACYVGVSKDYTGSQFPLPKIIILSSFINENYYINYIPAYYEIAEC